MEAATHRVTGFALTTFPNGVHPPMHKDETAYKPLGVVPVPNLLRLPLNMHIGAPAKPILDEGAEVKKGDLMAEPGGFVSAGIHAPTSGVYKGVALGPHPLGRNVPCMLLEPDGKDEWGDRDERDDYLSLSPARMRQRVQAAGIVGMGGAGFPTHVKLTPPKEKTIDLLIINGAECEPYLTADQIHMMVEADKIVKGTECLMHILGVKRAIIATEDNKPESIDAVVTAINEHAQMDIGMHVCKTKYPEGGEKQLIQSMLQKEVPSGGLPMDIGIVMQNTATTAAVYDAVRFDIPLIDRIGTVTGEAIAHPQNVRFLIGTPAEDFINYCGGLTVETGKVVFGGPMMGFAQYTLDAPAIKGTGGVLCLPVEAVDTAPSEPCIRCGKCITACPAGLFPSIMGDLAERFEFEETEKWNVLDCIECGACAYVCPARRPLVHFYRHAKADILARQRGEKHGAH